MMECAIIVSQEFPMIWLAVGAGGALGSLARHGVNIAVAHLLGRALPYATACVNITGSLAIGWLAALIASGRLQVSNELRAFIFVGILGGFTTFSSLMFDTLTLSQGGEHSTALWNVILQTAFGLAAVWSGYRLALT
jgi:CrcB protein